MKTIYLILGLLALAVSTGSHAKSISGVWNVISEATYEHNCKKATPGSTQAYVWLVSTTADNKVTVTVQGETGFKKLQGVWVPNDNLLILDSKIDSAFSNASSWFKLEYSPEKKLMGVRRYIGESGNIRHPSNACFADFTITATKQ